MSTGASTTIPVGHSSDLDATLEHPYVRYLRTAMQREGLSPDNLAARSGISKGTVSLILNGKQDPRTITNPIQEALSITLRVPMYRLVEHAGYKMFDGDDIPAIVVDVVELDFPSIRSLSDLNKLSPEKMDQLIILLERHLHRSAMR